MLRNPHNGMALVCHTDSEAEEALREVAGRLEAWAEFDGRIAMHKPDSDPEGQAARNRSANYRGLIAAILGAVQRLCPASD